MVTLPTYEQLLELNEDAWDDFVNVCSKVSIKRAAGALAELVKDRFAADCNEDDEFVAEYGETVPIKALFGSYEYDNGWFYDEGSVTLILADGRELDYFDMSDSDKAHELLADLSSRDAVGSSSLMTLDLRDGSVKYNSHGNS